MVKDTKFPVMPYNCPDLQSCFLMSKLWLHNYRHTNRRHIQVRCTHDWDTRFVVEEFLSWFGRLFLEDCLGKEFMGQGKHIYELYAFIFSWWNANIWATHNLVPWSWVICNDSRYATQIDIQTDYSGIFRSGANVQGKLPVEPADPANWLPLDKLINLHSLPINNLKVLHPSFSLSTGNMMTSPTLKPRFLYKIVPSTSPVSYPIPEQLAVSELDEGSGFIHLSTARQVANTLKTFFAEERIVYVLRIEYRNVEKYITWEAPKGGMTDPLSEEELFPVSI